MPDVAGPQAGQAGDNTWPKLAREADDAERGLEKVRKWDEHSRNRVRELSADRALLIQSLQAQGVTYEDYRQAALDLLKAAQSFRRHFVRLVIAQDSLSFEGEQTTWEQLPERLEKVSNRASTVLELAVASDNLTIAQLNAAQGRVGNLSREFGFEYLSYIGVQPLGSKGSPSGPVPNAQAGQASESARHLGHNPALLRAVQSDPQLFQELSCRNCHERNPQRPAPSAEKP
jgi:hypothetical protein